MFPSFRKVYLTPCVEPVHAVLSTQAEDRMPYSSTQHMHDIKSNTLLLIPPLIDTYKVNSVEHRTRRLVRFN